MSGTPGVATEKMKLGNILKHESNEYIHLTIILHYFLIDCCFKVSGNGFKFEKKSKQKKNDSPVSGTRECNSPVSQTPGSGFLLVSGIPGSFDSRCPGYLGVLTPGVPDTGEF